MSKKKEAGRPWRRLGGGSSSFAVGADPREDWVVALLSEGPCAEKEGGDGKGAARSSGKRRQMGGGDSTRVEAAKRRRQD